MARVHALGLCPDFRSTIGSDLMNQQVKYVFGVKRPLDTPCTDRKIGIVLSHAGIMCVTEQNQNVLIEYMFGSKVYISECTSYKMGEDFVYKGLPFVHTTTNVQGPNCPVTVREMAQSMADIMRGRSFETYTHNCHQARYLTMKKYGMKSINPRAEGVNVFFQGLLDFYQKPKKLATDK